MLLSVNPSTGCGPSLAHKGDSVISATPGVFGARTPSNFLQMESTGQKGIAAALPRERWHATTEQHAGMFVGQARRLGATVPSDILEADDKQEVCTCCRMLFRDFRAWAVHAFKRHERAEEVRRLSPGLRLQCSHCFPLCHQRSVTQTPPPLRCLQEHSPGQSA